MQGYPRQSEGFSGRRPRGLGGHILIVLDTATWIWRASDPRHLTSRARRAIDQAGRTLVSAISVWEVAMLVAKRRIQLDRPVEQWVDIALALPGLQLVPLEPAIAVRSTKLPGELHPDPADRIIIATALENAARSSRPTRGSAPTRTCSPRGG
jgi:PIN domain nuclease of toxin-antitoxin system